MSAFSPQAHLHVNPRPIYYLLFTYMAGLIVGLYWHPPQAPILAVSLSSLFYGSYCLIKHCAMRARVLLSVGIVMSGALLINHQAHPDLPLHHVYYWANNDSLTVEGFLFRPAEYLPQETRLYVRTQRIWIRDKAFPATGNLLITTEGTQEKFLRYDRIIFPARLRKPRNFGNPGNFNYVRWLAFQNIYATGHTPPNRTVYKIGIQDKSSFLRKVDAFRHRIREVIDLRTPSPSSLFLRASILGEGKIIPDEIMESFNRSGTAHVIAISGLNIGIVAAVSYFIIRRLLGISELILLMLNVPKVSASLTLVPVFLYTLIAGAGVSVQRAFIMVATYLIALIFSRERDLYHALAVAALAILVFHPPSLFEASFQLSFVSVWGILLFSPRLLSFLPERDVLLQRLEPPLARKARRECALLVVVTISAMLATGPVVAYYFNRFPLLGLIANLVIVPPVGFIIVPLGLLGAFLTPLSPFLAGCLFQISAFLSALVIRAASFFASISWTSFLVPTPTLIEIALLYAGLLCFFLWKSSRPLAKVLVIAFPLLIIDSLYWHFHLQSGDFRVTFIDVGQGDAALLRFPRGGTMLIDGGGFPNHRFDTGKNIIAPFLLKQGITSVDYMVASHPHPDHFDGLRYIAKNFSVKEFWYNGESINDLYFEELLTTLKGKGVVLRKLDDRWPDRTIQGVTAEVLHPSLPSDSPGQDPSANANNRSLVLRLSYGDVRYLFPGDVYSPTEEKLVARKTGISASVLKIPHHGSQTSANPDFIRAVGPRVVICSVGRHNPFRLPHPRTINLYRTRGCIICRTDIHGAIFTRTDGKKLSLRRHWRSGSGD